MGVYIDAFNLYYGARDLCGRNEPGWRWLDILALVEEKVQARSDWTNALVTSATYCTALREKDGDASSARDQRAYIAALEADSRIRVEYGQCNPKLSKGLLAKPGRRGKRGRLARTLSPGPENVPQWLPATEVRGPEGDMNLMVHLSTYEEKGSDVNIATRLMEDVFSRRIDAAVVVSNDGDLKLPLQVARSRIPVAVLNPTRRPTSAMLQGQRADGVGRHWWLRLTKDDIFRHQFAEIRGSSSKPPGW